MEERKNLVYSSISKKGSVYEKSLTSKIIHQSSTGLKSTFHRWKLKYPPPIEILSVLLAGQEIECRAAYRPQEAITHVHAKTTGAFELTVSKSFYCHQRSCNWAFLVCMICQNVSKSMRFQKKTKGWEIRFGKLKDQSINCWGLSILFLHKKILDSNRTEGRRIDRSVKLTWSATALTALSILNRALHFHSDHSYTLLTVCR